MFKLVYCFPPSLLIFASPTGVLMLLSEKQHIVYKDDAEKGYERRKPPEAARELKDMHL